MNTLAFVLAVIVGLLLAETRLSRLNERWLRAQGAIAPEGDVYGALALLYPAAFILMGLEGLYGTAVSRPQPAAPSWFAAGLLMVVASKGLKYWAIRELGQRWSFRVLIQPGRAARDHWSLSVHRSPQLPGGRRRARRHGYDV